MNLKLLVAIIGLQVAWIGGTSLVVEHELSTGKKVRLETERVDPRDFLRGDYLILNYKISSIPVSLFAAGEGADLKDGTRVYAGLIRQGDYFTVARASTRPLDPLPGEVVLQGKISWGRLQNSYRVTYGIERCYVPENESQPKGKLSAEVCIPRSGRGLVTRVFEDGRPLQAE